MLQISIFLLQKLTTHTQHNTHHTNPHITHTPGLKIRRESANRFAWRFPSGPNSANPSGFAWGEDRGWQKKMKFSNSIQCCERSFNRSVTDRERRFPFSNLRFRLTVFFIVLSLNTEKHYIFTKFALEMRRKPCLFADLSERRTQILALAWLARTVTEIAC